MSSYTIQISLLSTPTQNADNITRTVLQAIDDATNTIANNDVNNLLLYKGDTVTWQMVGSSYGGWQIGRTLIGKRTSNVSTLGTTDVFTGTNELTTMHTQPIPANIENARYAWGPTPRVTVQAVDDKNITDFAFRVYFEKSGQKDWWIDPELDVCPADMDT